VRHAVVRALAGEVRHHPALIVWTVIEPDIALAAHPGLGTVGADHQGGLQLAAIFQRDVGAIGIGVQRHRLALHEMHVMGKTQGGVQRLVQVAVFHDPAQGAGMGAIGVEIQGAGSGAVAVDQHGIHRRDAGLVHGAPYFQAVEQAVRGMVQGEHPHIPAGLVGPGWRRGRPQHRDAQSRLGKGQGGCFGNGAIADDADRSLHMVVRRLVHPAIIAFL